MKTRMIAAPLLALSLSLSAYAEAEGGARAGQPSESLTAPTNLKAFASSATASSGTTTSVVCYFTNGTKTKWEWGLNNDNSWYKLNGSWATTQYTKLMKFFTNTSAVDITNACNTSKSYYKLSGYNILAIFAADSRFSRNYPIVINNSTELYPQY